MSRVLKVMYHNFLKIIIEYLLKLPKNPITDLVASRLLSYFKQGTKLLEYATSRVIATLEHAKAATDDLAIISKLKKLMDGKRKDYLERQKAQQIAYQVGKNTDIAGINSEDILPLISVVKIFEYVSGIFAVEQRKKYAIQPVLGGHDHETANEDRAETRRAKLS